MKNFCLAVLLFSIPSLPSLAQNTSIASPPPPSHTATVFIARTGEQLDTPHVGTYHYFQMFQTHGKWIVPDVGYIDFGTGNYRELFFGAGRTLYDGKKLMMAEELYFVQATGSAAKSARYLWPWTIMQIHITPKFSNETVYFPYLPLNQPARIQHVLERSKFEYSLTKSVKVGAGYAGYKYGENQWQNRPMATSTISTRVGAFEFWLQKVPGGTQAQIRYALVHFSR